ASSNPDHPVILVLGDSISAAYGIPEDVGWVALLQEKLNENHYQFNTINASITGETTSGGAHRIDKLIEEHAPELVIIELGGNDGLRGLSLKRMRTNLEIMIRSSQASGAKVLLLGMRIPPNYGVQYTTRFENTYVSLAEEFDIPLQPFFLVDVAERRELMQDDGIHPGVDAQPLMLERVWPELLPLLAAR
ncbi:MAG: arylesterase, partial [Pseudomonadota bacterium]